jgi:hypothetical protein
MGNHGSPKLDYAITHSCDGYYYRLALKLGIDGITKMVETFDYDKPSGIDLPNEKISQTPKSWRPIVEKREGRWSDIRTVLFRDRAGHGRRNADLTPPRHRKCWGARQNVCAPLFEGVQADRPRW